MDKLNKGTKIVYKFEFIAELRWKSTPEEVRFAARTFIQGFENGPYTKQIRCLSIEVDGKRLGD